MKHFIVITAVLLLQYTYGFPNLPILNGPAGMPYRVYEMEETSKQCFFPIELKDCSGEVVVHVIAQNDAKTTLEVSEDTTEECLETKCTGSDSTLDIKEEVEIGGVNVTADPDVLKPGSSKTTFYTAKADCLDKKDRPVTFTCVKERMEELNEDGVEDSDDDEERVSIQALYNLGGAQQQNGPDKFLGPSQGPIRGPDGSVQQEFTTGEQELDDRAHEYSKGDDNKVPGESVGFTKIQWHNWFRYTLYVHCPNHYAIYYMRSYYHYWYRDRVFQFYCKRITNVNYNHCYWTGYQNLFHLPTHTGKCNEDYVMTGVYSIYHYSYNDREFSILCCRSQGYSTRSCYQSDYTNTYFHWQYYYAHDDYVFTGLSSWYYNHDRIYKVDSCRYVGS